MSDKSISGQTSISTAYSSSTASTGTYRIYGGFDTSSSYNSYTTVVDDWEWLRSQKQTKNPGVRIFIEKPYKNTRDHKLHIIDCIDTDLNPLISRARDITFKIGIMDGQDLILEIINLLGYGNPLKDAINVKFLISLDLKMSEYHRLYMQSHGIKSIRRYFFGIYFAIKQSIDVILSERIENYMELPVEVREWVMTFLRQGRYSPYQSLVEQLNSNYADYLSEKAKLFLPTETAA